MRTQYHEILTAFQERGEKPLWFDEHGVPRFVPFAPGEVANIYAYEVMLQEIACQNCDKRFNVVLSRSSMDDALASVHAKTFNETYTPVDWAAAPPHYGDPPNVDCCQVGPSMNVELIGVIEHWRREQFMWSRVQAMTSF